MYVLVMSSPAGGGGDFPHTEISGRWVGDRVVIVGDYTHKDAIPNITGADAIYSLAQAQYVNITSEVRTAFEKIFNIAYDTSQVGTHTFWNRVLA
jgi:hypothetical protein